MRIGFDAKRLFCNPTGLGNYSRTLLSNLDEYYPANEYHLYTPEMKEDPQSVQFINNPKFPLHLPSGYFKSYWRTFSIVNQMQKDGIELYHGLSNEIPMNIQRTKIRSVVTIHDLIFKVHPETYSMIDKSIYNFKCENACDHADRIIAISESVKSDIVKHYSIAPDKIDVIYQPCNPIYYHLQNAEEVKATLKQYQLPPQYLLNVGSMGPRKNLKTLIEAYAFLSNDCKIPLVIVGKGRDAKIEKLIKATGIEKYVVWVDHVKDIKHLQAFYQGASALIYPSLYEGFGLPVAEALLSKTPVITSYTSSLPEAGGLSSLYFNPAMPEHLAVAIEKVLCDSALRENMIDKGFNYAHKTFNAEVLTKKVMECYKKVI